jgi:hypothetical protein
LEKLLRKVTVVYKTERKKVRAASPKAAGRKKTPMPSPFLIFYDVKAKKSEVKLLHDQSRTINEYGV